MRPRDFTPLTEEKNGRTYREYDEKTVRTLMTVGILRRAEFTIEQIAMMLASTEKIAEVFAEYKDEIRDKAERLRLLDCAVSAMDGGEFASLDAFADCLEEKMGCGPDSPSDEMREAPPAIVRFHHHVWDEDISAEEKEAAYRRFIKNQERRDKISHVLFTVPRKIGAGFRWMKERVNRIIRDGQGKVKKSTKTFIAFLCVGAVLVAGLSSAVGKLRHIEDDCTRGIYGAMHNVVYALRNTISAERYTYGHSEVVCRNLALIGRYVRTADDVYYHVFNQLSREYHGTDDLVRAMGCTYTGRINSDHAEAILYDGELSEKEMQFIELLYADLSEVYAIMLDEDGLNPRDDLDYDMIHDAIHAFLDKWGRWRDMNYDTPYALLDRD